MCAYARVPCVYECFDVDAACAAWQLRVRASEVRVQVCRTCMGVYRYVSCMCERVLMCAERIYGCAAYMI